MANKPEESVAANTPSTIFRDPIVEVMGRKLSAVTRVVMMACALYTTVSGAAPIGTPILFDVFPGWQQGMAIVKQGDTLPTIAGKVVFFADDGNHGVEPWVSDGTQAGTYMLKDIHPGAATSGGPSVVGRTERYVLFFAEDGTHGMELWRTDGTQAGTIMLGDIEPGPRGSGHIPNYIGQTLADGRLVLPIETATFGGELWITDGTPEGTRLLRDWNIGADGSRPQHLVAAGGKVFFTLRNNSLWVTDGSSEGTKELYSAPYQSEVIHVNNFRQRVIAWSNSGVLVTDGTSAGTAIVAEQDSYGSPMLNGAKLACGTRFYWWDSSKNLRFTDGTPGGSGVIHDSTAAGQLGCLGDSLVFGGTDVTHGTELWSSESGAGAAALLKDINPGVASSGPRLFTNFGSRLLFAAVTASNGDELWVTDGTSAGTSLLADAVPYTGSSNIAYLTVADGIALFGAGVADNKELWVTDGTAEGTKGSNEMFAGLGLKNPEQITRVPGGVFFTASATGTRRELWFLPFNVDVALARDVVEFYHAQFDHYFVSEDPAEISALDTGYFQGWSRTGYTFKVVTADSPTPQGASPVCRFYGDPAAGLDSHFYGASPVECDEVDANFPEWIWESDNVFQVYLPNTSTGACPAGTIPLYRVFNRRSDANHRYTTSTAVVDQMVARGGIAEGYGPGPHYPVMCSPQ